MIPLKNILKKFIKEIQFMSPLRRYLCHRYRYLLNPAQLCFLCHCIEETRNVPGAILEIGCAEGSTTVFLNKYMDFLHLEKPYICIDTFKGFIPEDVRFEVTKRGKRNDDYHNNIFSPNSVRWFNGTMKTNNIKRVTSIKADICKFDFETLGKISFCLIDVDLYRPTKKALEGVFDKMNEGGIVIIDDCVDNNAYDGVFQATREFAIDHSVEYSVYLEKLGKIKIVAKNTVS